MAADAPELRRRAERDASRSGSSGSRTGPAPLPELTVNTNWAYHKYDHLFGTFLYKGAPVHGFRSTAGGNPLDTFGRNLYVDTFNSAYGAGWKRENSFLMHKGTGTFCYGFYPHGSHPIGKGERYRATIIGPGVTPDVMWQGNALGAYDPSLDQQLADEAASALRVGSSLQGRLSRAAAPASVGSAAWSPRWSSTWTA